MKNILLALAAVAVGIAAWIYVHTDIPAGDTEAQSVEYKNTEYGFSISLPQTWKGFQVVTETWEGSAPGSAYISERGPRILIRNPKWTKDTPYQDIPIMVFTSAQWEALEKESFYIGAAPIDPKELGHNPRYVFALPARYNYAFPAGWEEVEQILAGDPLKAF
jgi:hypothetical protein